MKRTITALLALPAMLLGVYQDCEIPAGVIDPCEPTCILPSAGPFAICGTNLFITADFIYWTARLDGLGYAMTGKASQPNVVNAKQGKIFHPEDKFRPGFKAGIGAKFHCDVWDIYANFTYLQIHNTKSSVSAPSNPSTILEDLWAIQSPPVGGQIVLTKASGKWSLKFNVLDLELGRNFFVSPRLALRPFIGAKGTWQDQDYDVVYHGNTLINDGSFRSKITQDLCFTGGGLRAGVNSSWLLGCNLSLFGNAAFSTIWGQFDVVRRQKQKAITPPGSDLLSLDMYNRFHTNKAVLELAAGIRYDIPLYCKRYNLRFQAGWEQQHWFSQNQFIRLLEESAHGDLVLHGLTLEGRFDF
ncbi:MAG: hypothetical protein Tsb0015_06510 [Simkaniaceae bacterium]